MELKFCLTFDHWPDRLTVDSPTDVKEWIETMKEAIQEGLSDHSVSQALLDAGPNFIELLSRRICLAWNFFLGKNRFTNQIYICCILLITGVQLLFAYPVNHMDIWLVMLCFMLSKFLCLAALWNWALSLSLVFLPAWPHHARERRLHKMNKTTHEQQCLKMNRMDLKLCFRKGTNDRDVSCKAVNAKSIAEKFKRK